MTKGIGQLGLVDRAAEAPERQDAPLHPGQGDRRRLLDQRPDLHPRQRRATTTRWAARRAAPAGATGRAALFHAAEDNSASPTTITAMAARSACRTRSRRCRSARPISRAAQELGIPLQPRLQRRAAGRRRLLPAHPAQRPPLLGGDGLSRADPRPAEPDRPHRRAGDAHRRRGRPRRRRRDRWTAAAIDRAASARCIVSSGAHRLAAAADAVGHRPGRPPAAVGVTPVPRPARRRLEPPGPSRPLRRSAEVHRRPHLRQLRQAAPDGAGRACSTCCSEAGRWPRASSRPAASGTPTRTRARPTSSSISASARASRPASRRCRTPA